MTVKSPDYFVTLRRNITDALKRLREARTKGDKRDIDAAETLMNNLIERLAREEQS